jgi:methionyl-tRNA formyltransferase
MHILFLGTPEFAVPSLKALIGSPHRVLAVVTQPDKPRGRKLRLSPSPVKDLALAHGLECLQPESLNEEGFKDRAAELTPDACVVVAYGKLIPSWLLNLPPHGCLNVHASLLPKYRGAAPIQRAIMEGERQTGITIMLLDEGMDTGPGLKQAAVDITEDDISGTLYEKLALLGADLLRETLDEMEKDRITPIPQDDSLATYAPKIEKDEREIDWSRSAKEIRNLVRALNPTPGAFATYARLQLKVWATKVKDDFQEAPPGTVLEAKHRLVAATASGAIELLEVQPANKDRMSGEEFSRGYRVKVGERFGDAGRS